ncbi:DNA-3-methyladenine glycosylase 2 family protein [Thalassotalea sp. ND16A]|uniref:DNA-3-methyladenine glycosylase 2 family protein n=1 Tax=Thalassotalea sp. ND16A TaxID=1535422 RepID=UPI00068FAB32|nr:DNA-3-methyladenine glycosylase 2 [Thalassotalea sp. ND16A]
MQARLSRDLRFDGKFFTAVLTTGIYCRPTCPAGPAKEENVRYYQSAAQAEFNGYQPCKRCKPELSPEQKLPSHLSQALNLITISPQLSVHELALQLQLSERQVQRLFKENLGLNPNEFINQKRQISARNLLLTSSIAIADVAIISGFGSTRSFNEHIKKQYKLTPSQLRKSAKSEKHNHLRLKLKYQGMLNWPLMLDFFRARVIPGVELVTNSYQRTITIDNCHGWIKVSKDDNNVVNDEYLNLDVMVNDYSQLPQIISRVRKMFDLDCNLAVITEHLGQHKEFQQVIVNNQGLRLPGCWDIFEFSIRAILGQQISVKAATTLAGRIAKKYAEKVETESMQRLPAGLELYFPSAQTLINANFTELGITDTRQQTLRTWIEFFNRNQTLFRTSHNTESFEKTLCELKGIGPWTANYMAMRGLSLPDAFPAADLGIIKALTNKAPATTATAKPLTAKQILAMAEQWRPWRSYAAIYLWQTLAPQNNNE